MGPRYRFGAFDFDVAERRLLRDGREVELQPKMCDALGLFVERAGRLVSREELMDALWPDVVVNEEALTQLVKKLRRALGDDAKEPRYLQTVLKRGYRFVYADVVAAHEAPAASALVAEGEGACQPPRASYDPAWYVPRRAEEQRARDFLAGPGMPVVLVAPERFGKTWMLRNLLRGLRGEKEGARVVLVSLDLFDREAQSALDPFLRHVALQLCDALGIDAEEVEAAWRRSANPKANLNWLVERQVLPANDGPLVVAVDRADAVWGRPFQDEFFGLLRAWAENGAENERWSRLRLMLAISTTPALLIADPSQSPFNLTDPIRLQDLDEPQVRWLSARHGLAWGDREIGRLRALVGGHPYLLRLVMYAARSNGGNLGRVLEDGGRGDASARVFHDYLAHCRGRLARKEGLAAAFARIAAGGPAPDGAAAVADAIHVQRLVSAGLVVRDDAGVPLLRYPLYAELVEP
jgi:DNA-binding winged helix-turn-helix (wHTH) protein